MEHMKETLLQIVLMAGCLLQEYIQVHVKQLNLYELYFLQILYHLDMTNILQELEQ